MEKSQAMTLSLWNGLNTVPMREIGDQGQDVVRDDGNALFTGMSDEGMLPAIHWLFLANRADLPGQCHLVSFPGAMPS